MAIVVTVRIEATLEQIATADRLEPGLYDEIIALAREHGMLSHRRVYRDGAVMDIDEWPSEEARDAFRAVAQPLITRMGAARGTKPSAAEIWHDMPGPNH
ncbi:unannotated protein [freshwater metagenome]|uniref:Unannotated protein n=1 Tax=freshwater metagenome TaxID=449393 RepID=A0A6J6Q4Z1_9ZZZZ